MSTQPKHRLPHFAHVAVTRDPNSRAKCSDPGDCGAGYCPKHRPASYAAEFADHRTAGDRPVLVPASGDRSILLTYPYTVMVKAATKKQADQVMSERLNPDEDYGFDYSLAWMEEDV